MLGYIVFWATIRNGIVDMREYIMSYEMSDPNKRLIDVLTKTEGSFDKKYWYIFKKRGDRYAKGIRYYGYLQLSRYIKR